MIGASRTAFEGLRESFDELAGSVDLDGLSQELFDFVDLLDRERPLRRALSDPSQSANRKTGLAHALFDERVSSSVARLLAEAAGTRWSTGTDFAEAFERLAVFAAASWAERDRLLDTLEDELFRFSRIVAGRPALRTALADAAAPAESKRQLLDDLLANKVTAPTLRLVVHVCTHPRGRSLERGLEIYARLVAARRERLIARVRAAVPLTDRQKERLAESLTAIYGHEVHVNTEIDPRVSGGLIVRIGDEVIDGTIAERLDVVRRRLAG